MQIERMTADHLDAVLAIEAQTQLSPWPASEFLQSLNSQRRRAWVALINNCVAGFAVYNLTGPEAELLTISIDPSQQNKGLGRTLLLATSAQLDFETLFLEVRESNAQARSLYEHLGFNEIGRRRNYYPIKQGREDALLYAVERCVLEF